MTELRLNRERAALLHMSVELARDVARRERASLRPGTAAHGAAVRIERELGELLAFLPGPGPG